MPTPPWPGFSDNFHGAQGVDLNALCSFFKSVDGLVAIGGIVLLGVVSHYGSPYNPWINLLARVGNIAIFLYIIWRVAGKSFLAAMSARRAEIAETLDSLARRKREAEERLRELEERISGLDAERREILEESKKQAETLRASIVAQAEADAERIREQASRAADSEAKAARDALRAQLADEIVLAVEEVLKTRLTSSGRGSGKGGDAEKDEGLAAGHARLIDNALKRVVLH